MRKPNIHKLADLVEKLRGEQGCPWDKEQTRETLKPMLVEETYEVIDALDSENPKHLLEELGDLLFQVVFHSQIAAERHEFTLADVIDRCYEKMVGRHPHVFGDAPYKTTQEVLRNWEDIKTTEKAKRYEESERPASILQGLPKHLPALYEAYQLTAKASRVGFDWRQIEGLFDKMHEEMAELQEAVNSKNEKRISNEVGDMIFVVVNIARFLNVDPESALRRSIRKFIQRFQYIEEAFVQKGKRIQDATLEEMDLLWNEAKQKIKP